MPIFSCRRMNTFLIIFLVVLVIYSAIWVGLKHWFYSNPLHSDDAMWYTEPEPSLSVSPIIMLISISSYLQRFVSTDFLSQMIVELNQPRKPNVCTTMVRQFQLRYQKRYQVHISKVFITTLQNTDNDLRSDFGVSA